MKSILFTVLLGASLVSQAAGPRFGGFIHDNVLYVTVLGDSCNVFSMDISVAGICHENRMTTNFAEECEAELLVGTTKMLCPTDRIAPHVEAIDLEDAGVAKEAKVLVLKYAGKAIRIKINK